MRPLVAIILSLSLSVTALWGNTDRCDQLLGRLLTVDQKVELSQKVMRHLDKYLVERTKFSDQLFYTDELMILLRNEMQAVQSDFFIHFIFEQNVFNDRSMITLSKEFLPKGITEDYEIHANGIALKAYNYLTASGELIHHYPKVSYHRSLLRRLNDLFNLVVESTDNLSFPTDEYVNRVSDYYHLAINGHFFSQGNDSLFMSQVNYFLTKRGFELILQGRLDQYALVNSYKPFRELFKSSILASKN